MFERNSNQIIFDFEFLQAVCACASTSFTSNLSIDVVSLGSTKENYKKIKCSSRIILQELVGSELKEEHKFAIYTIEAIFSNYLMCYLEKPLEIIK